MPPSANTAVHFSTGHTISVTTVQIKSLRILGLSFLLPKALQNVPRPSLLPTADKVSSRVHLFLFVNSGELKRFSLPGGKDH